MFSLRREELMLSLRPADALELIPPASDRRAWEGVNHEVRRDALARADALLREPPEPLTAALLLSGAGYIAAHRRHRALLQALLVAACIAGGGRYVFPLADAIWAALERSSWCDPDPDRPELPDVDDPLIDLSCAETACALALAARLLGPELSKISPAILPRIARELRIRAFDALGGERTSALKLGHRDVLPAMDALMAAVLLSDMESDQRWLCLRYLCGLTERRLRHCLPDGGMQDGLERHVRDACALSNVLTMLSLGSGGVVELRDEPAFGHMALLPAALYVGGGWFVNPGGDSPRPALDPDALFLLGDSARSSELCALAAYLNRQDQPERAPLPIMLELQRALYRNLFLREPARLVQRPSVRLPAMQLLSARIGPFYACLSGGANRQGLGHLDVGDMALFYRDRPIIISPGNDAASNLHSVPEIELAGQSYTGLLPQDGADCRFDPGLTMLSLGIAHAYAKGAGLLNWQRSVMMSEPQGTVRLLDVVDFDHGEARQLAFHFMTPISPRLAPGAVLLGDVELAWEGELIPSIERIGLTEPAPRRAFGPNYHRIRFETAGPVSSGQYTFVFRPHEE